jgi:hypothetical protein
MCRKEATNRRNKEGLELNGTHRLLVSADINLFREGTEALLDSKDVCLSAHADRTECMVMSRPKTTGQNLYAEVINKSFGQSELHSQFCLPVCYLKTQRLKFIKL